MTLIVAVVVVVLVVGIIASVPVPCGVRLLAVVKGSKTAARQWQYQSQAEGESNQE